MEVYIDRREDLHRRLRSPEESDSNYDGSEEFPLDPVFNRGIYLPVDRLVEEEEKLF